MHINYSIIIPHHNIPKLLIRCLASIPNRKDTEIIIIDDNSSAEIVDFDNFPGKERENTKIFFSKVNGGGGYARNIGVQMAKGDKLIFADADDFFNDNLSDLLDDYVSSDIDVVYFNANSVDTDTYQPSDRAKLLNSWMNEWIKNHSNIVDFKYRFGEPWSKIISRNLVVSNHLKFDETPIHNDTRFSYLVGFYAKKIKIDARKVYCVTTRKGSTCRIISDTNSLVRIRVFGTQTLFFQKHNINVRKDEHLAELLRLLSNPIQFRLGIKELKQIGFSYHKIFLGLIHQVLANFKYKFIKVKYGS